MDHNNSNLREAFEGLQKIETLSDDEAREFLNFLNTYLTRYAHLHVLNPPVLFDALTTFFCRNLERYKQNREHTFRTRRQVIYGQTPVLKKKMGEISAFITFFINQAEAKGKSVN